MTLSDGRAVRQRLRSVLEWAVAMDLRNDNPCDRVLPVLGPQNDIVTHHRALPHKEVASAIATVRASGSAQAAVKLAFEFLGLTASRSAEVRLATWAEMDTAGQVWTVSAERMKAKRKHRVPLCRRALEIVASQLGGLQSRHFRLGERAMRFADGDRTVLIVNDHVRLAGIPAEAHGYLVNGRTPIAWFIDRYRVTRDRESGIVNDPNGWFSKPEDLVAAIRRIVHVSVETVRIVAGLPQPFAEPSSNQGGA